MKCNDRIFETIFVFSSSSLEWRLEGLDGVEWEGSSGGSRRNAWKKIWGADSEEEYNSD